LAVVLAGASPDFISKIEQVKPPTHDLETITESIQPVIARIEKSQFRKTVSGFPNNILGGLGRLVRLHGGIAILCYIFSLICLVYSTTQAISLTDRNTCFVDCMSTSWPTVGYYSFRGLLVICLVITLAKYSFLIGKTHMDMAMRNQDRRHAIMFGDYFTTAFKHSVTKQEFIKVYQDWNINRPSPFMDLSPGDFDPQLLKRIAALIGSFSRRK